MSHDRSRPDLDDATVEGLGKLSEALETVELLRDAGHEALADDLSRDLVGRNVVADRWTFQIVEDFDAHYWSAFRDFERPRGHRVTRPARRWPSDARDHCARHLGAG